MSSEESFGAYRWRKYGHKVLAAHQGKRFYYSCAHSGCPARLIIDKEPDDENAASTSANGNRREVGMGPRRRRRLLTKSSSCKHKHNHPPPLPLVSCARQPPSQSPEPRGPPPTHSAPFTVAVVLAAGLLASPSLIEMSQRHITGNSALRHPLGPSSAPEPYRPLAQAAVSPRYVDGANVQIVKHGFCDATEVYEGVARDASLDGSSLSGCSSASMEGSEAKRGCWQYASLPPLSPLTSQRPQERGTPSTPGLVSPSTKHGDSTGPRTLPLINVLLGKTGVELRREEGESVERSHYIHGIRSKSSRWTHLVNTDLHL